MSLPTETKSYLDTQPEFTQSRLLELRQTILDALDHTEEKMNYGILAFATAPGGKRDKQIMIAGYKSHVGFYPTPEVLDKFSSELTSFKSGKGSVQFPHDQPLPIELIKKMVKFKQELDKPSA
ncbi:MAG: DUF1801 domain-containing protein [Flavobacteriia bacterium]|nr:DUF1801 domain-containing protein [Flavobacteriia bacterium]